MLSWVRPLLAAAFSYCVIGAAHAVILPGPELDHLQRLQGTWQRHCYPSVDGDTKVYRRDFLSVDFTHMEFVAKVYLDDDCVHERTQYKARFQYALVGAYRSVGDKKIFPINVISNERDAPFFRLPSLNITAIHQAKLYFGRDFSGEAERSERLTQLDTRRPFIRH